MTGHDTKQLVLDIAMNCHRIGGWITDDYVGKKRRIDLFIQQTKEYIDELGYASLPESAIATKSLFIASFEKSVSELQESVPDKNIPAERLMTWGNILTHRASMFV